MLSRDGISKLITADKAGARQDERNKAQNNRQTLSDIYGIFSNIPALRGLWVPSLLDQTGAISDRSGQGRTLTYTGNPTMNVYNGLAPYMDYDGTDDYHARPDEAGLDIIGTETYIASSQRGLSAGAWVWVDALSGGTKTQGVLAKSNTVGNLRSWRATLGITDIFDFAVSSNGTAQVSVNTGLVIETGRWYFLAYRYTPSAEIAIWQSGQKFVNTTSIPASIFNTSAPFELARFNVANTGCLNGRIGLAFLSACAVSDELISHLYRYSKTVFEN